MAPTHFDFGLTTTGNNNLNDAPPTLEQADEILARFGYKDSAVPVLATA